MKRIGLFLGAQPCSGGTFQYNLSMLDAVASLPKKQFQVVVAYLNPLWRDYLKPYSMEEIKLPFSLPVRAWGKLLRACNLPVNRWQKTSKHLHPVIGTMAAQNCDLWIFPSQDDWSYRANVPALAAIHDLMHRYEGHFPEVSANGEYEKREKHYSHMCKWSQGILVDSQVGLQQVHEYYGVPPEQIFVLPYVPPRYINESTNHQASQNYKLPPKYIFYPAQFWEHKNHANLIKAIKLVKKNLSDIQLVLVGSPNNGYEKVLQLVNELNLQQNIHFMGYVPDQDMPYFYHRARAMVMPTFFGPTNIPQLEAFALGCPTATSNIYGIPQQVGDAALLFNPHSVEEIARCIYLLWTDDDLCQKLVQKGMLHTQKWGHKQFNRRLLEIIRQTTSLY